MFFSKVPLLGNVSFASQLLIYSGFLTGLAFNFELRRVFIFGGSN